MKLIFNPVQNSCIEVIWTDETTTGSMQEKEVKYVCYHPDQLHLLQADALAMGTPLDDYMPMLRAWVASYVPPTPPAPTLEDFDQALTAHLDAAAQQRRYTDRYTCALRAGYDGPFRAEGQAFASWMDTCNAFAYVLMADVQAGKQPMPASPAAFVEQLPEMVWPA